jgi:hypothetical protein
LGLTVGACPLEHLLFSRGADHDNRRRVGFIDLGWVGAEQQLGSE